MEKARGFDGGFAPDGACHAPSPPRPAGKAAILSDLNSSEAGTTRPLENRARSAFALAEAVA